MSDITVVINGVPRRVQVGASLASSLLNLEVLSFRHDGDGRPRAPLCGMGTCMECRVTVDGIANVRACMTTVRDGMSVDTAQ